MNQNGDTDISSKRDYKKLYFDFLSGLKDYMPEFIREECIELNIAEIPIKGPIKIFSGYTQGTAIVKNQGDNPCYLSTAGQGGYRLDPGQRVKFFVNRQVMATTISGTTVLGFIQT